MEFQNDVVFQGTLRVDGGILPSIPRTGIAQSELSAYPIPLTSMRLATAFHTPLDDVGSTSVLSLLTGTFGTGCPYVGTPDLKAAGGVTRYASAFVQLPAEYVRAESVKFRAAAGMLTTVADNNAYIAIQAYLIGRNCVISGSQLVTTGNTSINSLSFANKDFTLTTTTLAPCDTLYFRLTMHVHDDASVTAVAGAVAAMELLCDVQC